MDKTTLILLANAFTGIQAADISRLHRFAINGPKFINEGWFRAVTIGRWMPGFAPSEKLILAWKKEGLNVPPHTN